MAGKNIKAIEPEGHTNLKIPSKKPESGIKVDEGKKKLKRDMSLKKDCKKVKNTYTC